MEWRIRENESGDIKEIIGELGERIEGKERGIVDYRIEEELSRLVLIEGNDQS